MENAEDIRKKLESIGIPVDSWTSHGEKKIQIPIMEQQAELLGKIADLLRAQVEQDFAKLGDLEDALARVEKAKRLRGVNRGGK